MCKEFDAPGWSAAAGLVRQYLAVEHWNGFGFPSILCAVLPLSQGKQQQQQEEEECLR